MLLQFDCSFLVVSEQSHEFLNISHVVGQIELFEVLVLFLENWQNFLELADSQIFQVSQSFFEAASYFDRGRSGVVVCEGEIKHDVEVYSFFYLFPQVLESMRKESSI